VIRGVHQGRRFELDDDDASLGRGTRNRFRILDTEISRNHAVVRFEDDAYVLTDRNSSNGTFVNGLSVSSHRLSSGDQIQIGCTALLFSETTDSKHAVPVDIVSPPEEHSQIVSRIDADAGRQLLQASVAAPDDFSSTPQSSLRLLYQISEELVSASLSIEQLLQRILDTTLESVHADRGCVLIADPQTGELLPRAVAHARDNTEPERMPVSRSIVDYVLKKREGVRTSDARSDSRFASGQSIVTGGIREAMCVPMPGRYELMGVLYVDTTTTVDHLANRASGDDKFTDEHLNLLAAIGRQSALAVEDHRFQESLVKAERLAAVGQTIAMLSHHVKNILQGVRGGSYLIDMGLKGHDEDMIQQGWSVVEKNQDRIYQLMMDMLTFSTERQPKLESGDINALAQEVYELMEARAAELDVALRLDLGEDIPAAMFDAEGIHRAVLNIVINALDAVEEQEHAVVEIRTGSSDDNSDVWVEVADNGPGIPEEHVDSIFNLFESTKGGRGTGIGLAVSQKVIREHGGEILIDNQPNVGCRFRLLWPSLEDENRSAGRQTVRGTMQDTDEGFTEDSHR
jgi:signal transduction histidine kinase